MGRLWRSTSVVAPFWVAFILRPANAKRQTLHCEGIWIHDKSLITTSASLHEGLPFKLGFLKVFVVPDACLQKQVTGQTSVTEVARFLVDFVSFSCVSDPTTHIQSVRP